MMRKLPRPALVFSPPRDPFSFSLGGIRTIAPVVPAPAIAADQVNCTRDNGGHPGRRARRWLPGRRRLAPCGSV